MFTACCPIILASASPRRQDFLSLLGLQHLTVPAEIDETPEIGEVAEAFALRMATAKAEQVAAAHPEACVIGADTVVALDQTIFGKPRNCREALTTLQTLQGLTHKVITGVAVIMQQRTIKEANSVTSLVTFDTFTEEVLQAYVDSGEPMDKAGAYAIQGKGTFLIRSITGSYSNVVGLPVNTVVQVLLRHGFIQPCDASPGRVPVTE
jgi:septum formation protein